MSVRVWDVLYTVQAVKREYSKKHAEEGPSVKVAISGPHIKFEIPNEGTKLPSGWSLEPLVSPVVRAVAGYHNPLHVVLCVTHRLGD